jgi:hypothetical protein
VDYDAAPALGATTLLQFDVGAVVSSIPHGLAVIAPGPDGAPITFETGPGLRDRATTAEPAASPLWNRSAKIAAYWFDDSVRCLQAGATQIDVRGRGYGFRNQQAVLIETPGETDADPPLRQVVHLIKDGEELCDPLFPVTETASTAPFMTCETSPPQDPAPAAVTRLTWGMTEALAAARDLDRTTLIGNLCPATQGRTATEVFVVEQPGAAPTRDAVAIERTGARPRLDGTACGVAPAIRLYSLANAPLTWLLQPSAEASGIPFAEILLSQASTSGGPPTPWNWVPTLLSAGPFDLSFTVDPVLYRPVARNSDQSRSQQFDYDGDGGDTIRFGDSVFGANPDAGARFTCTYRYGAGRLGNVAAGAIAQLDPATLAKGAFLAVMNPFAATDGADAQSLQSVKRLAPQAFRAVKRRAVLAKDYAEAADTLTWVKSAGAAFRWTGSWLTTFTTPEPKDSEQIPTDDRTQLIELLNRRRMAGTESYVPDPRYASLDLSIEICAEPAAFAAGVEQAVLEALSPSGRNAGKAFFATNRFVFGQPLERSQLEAAIQAVPGVAGVTCITYRRRDLFAGFEEMGDIVPAGITQILRCDNDPSRPNNGALSVTVRGGR